MKDCDFIEITSLEDTTRKFISTCGNIKKFKPTDRVKIADICNDKYSNAFEENARVINHSKIKEKILKVLLATLGFGLGFWVISFLVWWLVARI